MGGIKSPLRHSRFCDYADVPGIRGQRGFTIGKFGAYSHKEERRHRLGGEAVI